jgi:hypothetical protein
VPEKKGARLLLHARRQCDDRLWPLGKRISGLPRRTDRSLWQVSPRRSALSQN